MSVWTELHFSLSNTSNNPMSPLQLHSHFTVTDVIWTDVNAGLSTKCQRHVTQKIK